MSASQEFRSGTNSFAAPQMPPHGYMMGNRPSFPNNSQTCFSWGPMNMMDPPKMMDDVGFNPFWNKNPMERMPGPQPTTGVQKEVLTFPSSVLYPPPPDSKLPSTRDRPPGCKTIFVGGLPKNITDAHLKEIFERSGEIGLIRLSKLNFAHIRFMFRASVERALYISGYYMKIANRDDPPNCGRLHVDYSCAREDQSEYECEQNKLAEEMKHRRKCEEEQRPPRPISPQSPPSPPKPVIYNENEASDIHEKLKKDDTMIRAMDILITWLERGDCTRKTVNVFYGLLQTINSNVRRLMSEKEAQEEEIRKLQESFRNRFSKILTQFEHVEKVFKTAGKQKSWDHFTKAQRKNIDFWSKQIQETRMSQQEEFFNEYQDDSMEMSDGEDGESVLLVEDAEPGTSVEDGEPVILVEDGESVILVEDDEPGTSVEDGEPGTSVEPPPKRKKSEIDVDMRYENGALKCKLEAYKNEIDMAKQESLNSLQMKNKEIKGLQLALQGMQKQLIASRRLSNNSATSSSANESTQLIASHQLSKNSATTSSTTSFSANESTGEINEKDSNLEQRLKEKEQEIEMLQLALQGIGQTEKILDSTSEDVSTHKIANSTEHPTSVSVVSTSQISSGNNLSISQNQLRLIGLVSCFLNVHPTGASPDYISSYLKQMQVAVCANEIEELLERLPSLFKQEVSGCGATLKRRWKFTGFHK